MRKRRKLKRGKLWRGLELSVASQSCPSDHITRPSEKSPILKNIAKIDF